MVIGSKQEEPDKKTSTYAAASVPSGVLCTCCWSSSLCDRTIHLQAKGLLCYLFQDDLVFIFILRVLSSPAL